MLFLVISKTFICILNIILTMTILAYYRSKPLVYQSIEDRVTCDLMILSTCTVNCINLSHIVHALFPSVAKPVALFMGWTTQVFLFATPVAMSTGIVLRYAQYHYKRILWEDVTENRLLAIIRGIIAIIVGSLCVGLFLTDEPPRFYHLLLGLCMDNCPNLNIKMVLVIGCLTLTINLFLRAAMFLSKFKHAQNEPGRISPEFWFLAMNCVAFSLPIIIVYFWVTREYSSIAGAAIMGVLYPLYMIMAQRPIRVFVGSEFKSRWGERVVFKGKVKGNKVMPAAR